MGLGHSPRRPAERRVARATGAPAARAALRSCESANGRRVGMREARRGAVRSWAVIGAAAFLLSLVLVGSARAATIGFETPAVVDPTHTFGEPDVGVDPLGRVFVSGPTGTGTQR